MKVQILHVPDCPNTSLLITRLERSGHGATDVDMTVIRDEGEAASGGMTGSPTLLVDGVDPFAVAGQSPSVSCRLYVDEAGGVSGAPSVTQLRAALAGTGSESSDD